MSKFQPGDKVVCIDDEDSDLDLFKSYIVKKVANDDGVDVTEYCLEGVNHSWMEPRFELLSEWEKYQKPADDKTQLQLAKMQVEMLQHYKKQAQYLLSRVVVNLDNCLINEIKKFLDTGKLP